MLTRNDLQIYQGIRFPETIQAYAGCSKMAAFGRGRMGSETNGRGMKVLIPLLVLAGCAADPHLSDPDWIFNGPNFCITNREPIMIKELCHD